MTRPEHKSTSFDASGFKTFSSLKLAMAALLTLFCEPNRDEAFRRGIVRLSSGDDVANPVEEYAIMTREQASSLASSLSYATLPTTKYHAIQPILSVKDQVNSSDFLGATAAWTQQPVEQAFEPSSRIPRC